MIIYMTRVKLVSISCFSFFKRILNLFGNIPPQNKDAEVASARKFFFDSAVRKYFVIKKSENREFGFGF